MNYLINNKVITSYREDLSLIQKMIENNVIKNTDGDKVYSLFKYLYVNTNRAKRVNTNLKMVVEGCGYTTMAGKGRINDQFKNILQYLNGCGYLGKNNYDFNSIKLHDTLSISTAALINIDDKGNYRDFVVLEAEEERVIRSIEGVNNNALEAYFLVIKSRMNNNEGEAQISYASVELMAKNIGISVKTARGYNEILEEADLIIIGNAGSYSKSVDGQKKYAQASNTYALASNPEAAEGINYSIQGHTEKMVSFGYKPHGKMKKQQ